MITSAPKPAAVQMRAVGSSGHSPSHIQHSIHTTPSKPAPLLWEAGWDGGRVWQVQMGELLRAENLHNHCTIPTERGLVGRVLYLWHHSVLKKAGVFFTTTAADVNRSCRCSDFLRGQTLEPNVMNIMVCLLLLCCLVDSAAQSCTAEQCPSLWNLSPPLPGDVSDINPLTLDHCQEL